MTYIWLERGAQNYVLILRICINLLRADDEKMSANQKTLKCDRSKLLPREGDGIEQLNAFTSPSNAHATIYPNNLTCDPAAFFA